MEHSEIVKLMYEEQREKIKDKDKLEELAAAGKWVYNHVIHDMQDWNITEKDFIDAYINDGYKPANNYQI